MKSMIKGSFSLAFVFNFFFLSALSFATQDDREGLRLRKSFSEIKYKNLEDNEPLIAQDKSITKKNNSVFYEPNPHPTLVDNTSENLQERLSSTLEKYVLHCRDKEIPCNLAKLEKKLKPLTYHPQDHTKFTQLAEVAFKVPTTLMEDLYGYFKSIAVQEQQVLSASPASPKSRMAVSIKSSSSLSDQEKSQIIHEEEKLRKSLQQQMKLEKVVSYFKLFYNHKMILEDKKTQKDKVFESSLKRLKPKFLASPSKEDWLQLLRIYTYYYGEKGKQATIPDVKTQQEINKIIKKIGEEGKRFARDHIKEGIDS